MCGGRGERKTIWKLESVEENMAQGFRFLLGSIFVIGEGGPSSGPIDCDTGE